MQSGNLVKHKVERTAAGKQFSNTPWGFCRKAIIKHTPGREWTFFHYPLRPGVLLFCRNYTNYPLIHNNVKKIVDKLLLSEK
ncbi:hypothetical protein K250101E9_17380 [Enterocloster aldenensis]|jgi:hypothetical protein